MPSRLTWTLTDVRAAEYHVRIAAIAKQTGNTLSMSIVMAEPWAFAIANRADGIEPTVHEILDSSQLRLYKLGERVLKVARLENGSRIQRPFFEIALERDSPIFWAPAGMTNGQPRFQPFWLVTMDTDTLFQTVKTRLADMGLNEGEKNLILNGGVLAWPEHIDFLALAEPCEIREFLLRARKRCIEGSFQD